LIYLFQEVRTIADSASW